MGKYSGKVLTVFITPSGVRVCEGENRNGNPDISKFFVVGGVRDYFSDPSNNRAPEIINMSGLVSAILEECQNRHTTARRVMVCSDCFGLETTVKRNSNPGGLKGLASGDVKDIGKMFKGDKEEKLPDKMQAKIAWGDIPLDGRINAISTVTTGDKYLLKSLVDIFYDHGYEVIYVSGSQEVLFNFWQTEPASFDSQGKLIFDYDVECRMSVFFKDLPIEINNISHVEEDEVENRLQNQISSALPLTQRNPHIYLAGSMFADPRFYAHVVSSLQALGYLIYDFFDIANMPADYEAQVERGDIDPMLTPDFSTNIAMLMAPFSKKLIALTPQVEVGDVLKKNSKTVAKLALGVSGLVFAASVVLAGLRGWELYQMSANPSNLDSLQQQVMSLSMRQQSLNSTIQTLTQADTTILDLMKFIEANQTERVAVVSMDTRDVLGDSMTVSSVNQPASAQPDATAEDTNVNGGSAGGAGVVRENIVIRGYAKTGNEAVSYFDRLFNYGLSGDPVLNGIERYSLPDGDEVYVFEIEIAGGASQ